MSNYKCNHCGRTFSSKNDANYHSCSGSPSQSNDGIVDLVTGIAIASSFTEDSSGQNFDSGSSIDYGNSSSDSGGGGDFGGGGSSDSF